MKRLIENLDNKNDNYIFPFLWMHGEPEEIIRDYMGKMQDSGVKAVCLEARPHPEFVKSGWWRDCDIILDEAKKRDMKIWILDDAHFPTGYANGAIIDRYPQYRKHFLKLHQLDFSGPCEYAQAILSFAFTDAEDTLEGVVLAQKTGYEAIDAGTIIDITDHVDDNQIVSFYLPVGEWKLMILVSTFSGGEAETEGYLNPIDPEATDVLLKEVYEPHYSHYQEAFGNTIEGFFSDEARFGNMHGPYGSIGRFDMVIPWRNDMIQLLSEKLVLSQDEIRITLPFLFVEAGVAAHQMRFHYMDLVSELFAENFSNRIGKWCHNHGVSYIGHVIEDNNAHSRLGYGAGHFYRSMRGQDMSGIDVVLNQLMPGMDHGYYKSMTKKGWDGEFFHYVLGKLGSSLGHLDPSKHGKTMCEVFGAYGWGEGNRLMKWITDYMLVRGVNEYVPHAFNMMEYPDADCPPHFYAHGNNPQYEDFKLLMLYMNRISHLISGGIHRAPAAVLYHGEAEWSGEFMLMQKPCAVLTRNQIDFDIVSQEMIIGAAPVNGELRINKESFKVLVIPYAEAMPYQFLEALLIHAENGLKLVFVEGIPVRSSEGKDVAGILEKLTQNQAVSIVTLEKLASFLKNEDIAEIKAASNEPYLRYYRYEHADGTILMFVNENPGRRIITDVQIPLLKGTCYYYDAFSNQITLVKADKQLHLELSPYESAVFCWSETDLDNSNVVIGQLKELHLTDSQKLDGPFSVSLAKTNEYPYFSENFELIELKPLQQIPGKENFTGIIKYEGSFSLKKIHEKVELQLDSVFEGARVSVNGSIKNVKICPPYQFDISEYVITGQNHYAIEVTTTLVRERYDYFSQYMLLEPTGITNAIQINQYGERLK